MREVTHHNELKELVKFLNDIYPAPDQNTPFLRLKGRLGCWLWWDQVAFEFSLKRSKIFWIWHESNDQLEAKILRRIREGI